MCKTYPLLAYYITLHMKRSFFVILHVCKAFRFVKRKVLSLYGNEDGNLHLSFRAAGIALLVIILTILLIIGCWYYKRRNGYTMIRVIIQSPNVFYKSAEVLGWLGWLRAHWSSQAVLK